VSYALENALFQWEEAERRIRDADPSERVGLEHIAARVLEGLRQRLGSEFSVQELSDLYGSQPDWTDDAIPSLAVDAAFARYAREASDFGGGRPRSPF
jgi:hypothetical protein